MNIVAIKNRDKLLDALEFTKLHHKADINVIKLCDKLLYINESSAIFGIIAENEHGTIVGSLLLIKQGFLVLEKNEMAIFNMSSWVILKDYRGVLALQMLSFTLKLLKNSCITNFTPNLSVIKILQAFKFSNLNAKRIVIPNFLSFPFYLIEYSQVKISFSSIDEINTRIHPWSRKFSSDNDAIFLTINLGKDKVVLGGVVGVNSKRLFGFNFNISYFSIYWISDDFLFSKMANKTIFVIRRFLKVNYLTISTISDYYSRLGFVKNENFFIYNNPNFIIDPIGSEIFL